MAFIYVNDDATGNNKGKSWENAYTNLQTALNKAKDGDRILIAKGTYKPTDDSDQTKSFELTKTGVEIYGGFAGDEDITDENFQTILDERDFTKNETILSGDIGNSPEDYKDNSDVVFKIDIPSTYPSILDKDITVDGLTVTGGRGGSNGAGIYYKNQSSNDNDSIGDITFSNLIIKNNTATNQGGGIYFSDITKGKKTFENITFENNSAIVESTSPGGPQGGGLYIDNIAENDDVDLINVKFINNNSYETDSQGIVDTRSTSSYGGGIYLASGSGNLNIYNGVFSGNDSGNGSGGGIYTSSFAGTVNVNNSTFVENESNLSGSAISVYSYTDLKINDSIFWKNQYTKEDSTNSVLVINDLTPDIDEATIEQDENIDPLFVDSGSGDLRLLPGSPAIDAGNGSKLKDSNNKVIKTDANGDDRFVNGKLDVGAYEFQPYLFVDNVTITEPTEGTTTANFTVTIARPASFKKEVTVKYKTAKVTVSNQEAATSKEDFKPTQGTLTFASGESTKTISVTIKADYITEGDEVFKVKLTNPTNAVVVTKYDGIDRKGIATILDSNSQSKSQQSVEVDSLIGDVDTLTGKVDAGSFEENSDLSLTDTQELVTSTSSEVKSQQSLELENVVYGDDSSDKLKTQDQELMNILPVAVDV